MLKTEFLHSTPQHELFSRINSLIASSSKVSIAVGFLTEAGANLIQEAVKPNPAVLNCFIVGATTFASCDGLDALISFGVPSDRLRVYLGHSRDTSSGFVKYHPMMHSKIYLFETDTRATLIVGSHNMTAFALAGQNSEASVLIEGDIHDPVFSEARAHLATVNSKSQQYDPSKRQGYAWWFMNLFQGMSYKVLDYDEDLEIRRNVVAVVVPENGQLPSRDDIVFMEVPRAFQVMKALGQPVHFYFLRTMPNSPQDAIAELSNCPQVLQGSVCGSNDAVVRVGEADWIVRDIQNPVMVACKGTVNPSLRADFTQVFIRVGKPLFSRYEYLFDAPEKWRPIYSQVPESSVAASTEFAIRLCQIDSLHETSLPWEHVVDLEPLSVRDKQSEFEKSLTPEGGGFIFFSRRRRKVARRRATGAAIEPRVTTNPRNPLPVNFYIVEVASSVPSSVWFALSNWRKDIDITEGRGRSFPFKIGQRLERGTLVSDKQAPIAVRILLSGIAQGFEHPELNETMIRQLNYFRDE